MIRVRSTILSPNRGRTWEVCPGMSDHQLGRCMELGFRTSQRGRWPWRGPLREIRQWNNRWCQLGGVGHS